MGEELHIVFDGPPSHESGRFVEVETADGKSINAGEWRKRPDGLWALVIERAPPDAITELVDALEARMDDGGCDPDSWVQKHCLALIERHRACSATADAPENSDGR